MGIKILGIIQEFGSEGKIRKREEGGGRKIVCLNNLVGSQTKFLGQEWISSMLFKLFKI